MGESSQRGHGGFAALKNDWLLRELHASESEVSTFIKASQSKNVRVPPAEEFPTQPRGMYSYDTENGSPAIPVPSTAGGEASAQRTPRQLLPLGTARESLSRIRNEGILPNTVKYLQAASKAGEPANLNGYTATDPDLPLPCSANDVDEAALAATSQATILDKGKGKASVSNTSGVKADPSNNHASTPGGVRAIKRGFTKIDKGKGKPVTFGESHAPASASGPSTSRVQEGNTSAMEHHRLHRGDAPFYAPSSGNEPTSSGAMGEEDGGGARADARKDLTSTWESTSGQPSEVDSLD